MSRIVIPSVKIFAAFILAGIIVFSINSEIENWSKLEVGANAAIAVFLSIIAIIPPVKKSN